ncbi:hypothetical protein PO883_10565 [Massilia sp. DJPM01]|uniref:phosphoketolase family protein n=1 Tax=Massilia sp. DJPM01 TaxID=3024404 RepID=UPI00259FC6F3|nr:hypothetical protein [Massilia sp. DJPM01]
MHHHANLHVHGFREEGTSTTPCEMVVLNQVDRLRLLAAVLDRVPQLAHCKASVHQLAERKPGAQRRCIEEHGIDLREIVDWRWRRRWRGAAAAASR